MEPFKYDISFTLCKQDLDFAKSIKREIRGIPDDKVFLYADNQKELISRIGPEAFRDVFLTQARVVVILYRKEYGESFYTSLEKEAIIERISHESDGYNFIFMIPMIRGTVPSWYPTTRLYADPYAFSVQELARFIEFKVVEKEGDVAPNSFNQILDKFTISQTSRIEKIRSLNSPTFIRKVESEIDRIQENFQLNVDKLLSLNLPFNTTSGPKMNPLYFGLNDFILEVRIEDKSIPNLCFNWASCYRLRISIFTKEKFEFQNIGTKKDSLEQKFYRFNYESHDVIGWSEEINYGNTIEESLLPFVYKCMNNNIYYYLSKFSSSNDLIDIWFSKLFLMVQDEFEQKL